MSESKKRKVHAPARFRSAVLSHRSLSRGLGGRPLFAYIKTSSHIYTAYGVSAVAMVLGVIIILWANRLASAAQSEYSRSFEQSRLIKHLGAAVCCAFYPPIRTDSRPFCL